MQIQACTFSHHLPAAGCSWTTRSPNKMRTSRLEGRKNAFISESSCSQCSQTPGNCQQKSLPVGRLSLGTPVSVARPGPSPPPVAPECQGARPTGPRLKRSGLNPESESSWLFPPALQSLTSLSRVSHLYHSSRYLSNRPAGARLPALALQLRFDRIEILCYPTANQTPECEMIRLHAITVVNETSHDRTREPDAPSG